MKQKLSFTTSIITILATLGLTSSTIPFLIFSSFFILMVKGGVDLKEALSEDYYLNEEMPKENFWKLFVVRLVMQIFPVLFILCMVYVFCARKDAWISFFTAS